MENLEETISFHRESLASRPAADPDRVRSLDGLATALSARFEQNRDFQDLEECISLRRESLALRPLSHPARSESLNKLASALRARFKEKGAFHDLEESIPLNRESLVLTPAPQPAYCDTLSELASALTSRFESKGDFRDLEESIRLCRDSLALRPPPNPDCVDSLHGLGTALATHFNHKGDIQDLEESIPLFREALSLRPAPHPGRFHPLVHLAHALRARFRLKGDLQDLEEIISVSRESLTLRAPPNIDYFDSLNNLASSLQAQFRHTGDPTHLDECISLSRNALARAPEPDPNRPLRVHNMASALGVRYQHKGDPQDLEEALVFLRESLASLPISHPGRCVMLVNLAEGLEMRFRSEHNPADLEEAFLQFKASATYETGPLLNRLRYSRVWAERAQSHDRPRLALDAFQCAITILPLLASLDLTLQQRQNVLTSSKDLVNIAARCAIEQDELTAAVTFMSTGRSVFWSQALQLRTQVDQLAGIDSHLIQELSKISRDLENASHLQRGSIQTSEPESTTSSNPTGTYTLAQKRNQILEEIRRIEGFEDFLRPPSFSSLQAAALNGPVVLLNAHNNGCDALILQPTGPVWHIPLPLIHIQDLAILITGINQLSQGGQIDSDVVQHIVKSAKRGLVLRNAASTQDGFELILHKLWISVVQPVVLALGFKKTASPPRIWWCPTGLFSFIPIHAAGIYSDDETADCLSDYAISSYCSSPQDLISPPSPPPADFKITAVIEPEAAGGMPLPATIEELRKIEARISILNGNRLMVHNGSKISPTHTDDVLDDIQRSSFVHFGCHGVQHPSNPLDSYLLLSEGELKMSKIIRECRTAGACLAYLSACDTARVDPERPDESLNLVATMMFAGFRSVVGTMWSIQDADAPIVADVFYGHLFRHGKETPPKVTDAAYALHLATKELRKQGKPFRNWVPFVHYGI